MTSEETVNLTNKLKIGNTVRFRYRQTYWQGTIFNIEGRNMFIGVLGHSCFFVIDREYVSSLCSIPISSVHVSCVKRVGEWIGG